MKEGCRMNYQKGTSLLLASAIAVSLATVGSEVVDESHEIIEKAEEAKIQFSHSAVEEQLELSNQEYYIEKLTDGYDNNLFGFLKSKNLVDNEGVVNMTTLLRKKEDRIPTGKGSDGKDVYKVEKIDSPDEDYKVMYYDENGESLEIGEFSGKV